MQRTGQKYKLIKKTHCAIPISYFDKALYGYCSNAYAYSIAYNTKNDTLGFCL